MRISRLQRSSIRHLLRHPWQTWLSVLGVTLGVAVVVAVDLANDSAKRSFALSVQAVTGRASHEIYGGTNGIPEAYYVRLRTEQKIRESAPLVEGLLAFKGETFTLLGVDPFAETSFRDLTRGIQATNLTRLLTEPGTVLLPAASARRLGLESPQAIEVDIGGRPAVIQIIGLFGPPDDAALDGFIVADVATAQELLDRPGKLDRIDLIVDEATASALQVNLPPGLELKTAGSRNKALLDMTKSFHVNLTAMSLLALLVGGFLIYNTVSFSVLRRRHTLGMLRSLGLSRSGLFRHVLDEAVVVGLLGTLFGLVLGVLLGRELVHLVARTINDLYYTLNVTGTTVDPWLIGKGMATGMITSLLAALGPAWEAAASPPLQVLSRSTLEKRSHATVPWLAIAGLLLVSGGLLLIDATGRSLTFGFVSVFTIIIGYSLLVPGAVLLLTIGLSRILGGGLGMPGRLAVRGLAGGLSRTALAVSALTVAVAATIGVGIMIDSFRATVSDWLEYTLSGDIYVSTASSTSEHSTGVLDPRVPEIISRIPGIAETSQGRGVRLDSNYGPVEALILRMASKSYKGFRFKGPALDRVWSRLHEGELLLASEPFITHHNLSVGDPVELPTDTGRRTFLIGGVFFDYSSAQGLLVIPRAVYDQYWKDPAISTVGVFLDESADRHLILKNLRKQLAGVDQALRIRPSSEIRERSLKIFDRTFAITQVLRLLTIGVAFVGILSALMTLQFERAKEHAVLRSTGVTRLELYLIVGLQTLIIGIMAGLLAIPLGWLLSDVLIDVINLRAFGWSLQHSFSSTLLWEGFLLATGAAVLAGVYPSWRVARANPARVLQEE